MAVDPIGDAVEELMVVWDVLQAGGELWVRGIDAERDAQAADVVYVAGLVVRAWREVYR
jgi:hypothetical protein